MTQAADNLTSLDSLIAELKQALANEDWEELVRLNNRVKPTLDPVMEALEAGELDADSVRDRLATLKLYCDEATDEASRAKAEARQALKEVNQNRNAAKAYRNISSNRPK